ncbi:hypothetical protein PMI29_00555 [Pseudomonas sp. GM49]|nr:hypothetical protein PMI29_00555 [Pseudomonas sp. GM49]
MLYLLGSNLLIFLFIFDSFRIFYISVDYEKGWKINAKTGAFSMRISLIYIFTSNPLIRAFYFTYTKHLTSIIQKLKIFM